MAGPGEIICLEAKLPDIEYVGIFTFDPLFRPMGEGKSADNRKLELRCLRREIVDSTRGSTLWIEN